MVSAFGFGTSQRGSPVNEKTSKLVPGPGHYPANSNTQTQRNRAPMWGMGSEKRVEPGMGSKLQMAVPGPTKYELPSMIQDGPKISLSPRIEDLGNKFIKIVPGPGAYTPGEKRKSNYSYSFGLKAGTDYPQQYLGTLPGPGAYDSMGFKTFSTQGASLDKGQRAELQTKHQLGVPGPGKYAAIDAISRNDKPKYGFGTSTRPDIDGSQSSPLKDKRTNSESKLGGSNLKLRVPGPGAYDMLGIIGKDGPMKSLAGRFKIDLTAKELATKPGPGQYSPKSIYSTQQSPNYKIGTSVREKYYLKDKFIHELPPPNIYDPAYEKTRIQAPSTGFGYGERSQMSKTTTFVPGPGQYKSPSAMGNGPTYVLGAKLYDSFEAKKMKEQPSPNHYNPNFDVLGKTQSVYSIGKSQRDEISGPRRLNVPGPGSYVSKLAQASFKDSPKWGFGSSERPSMGDVGKHVAVPGPGTYRLRSTFADVPSYLIPNQKTSYV